MNELTEITERATEQMKQSQRWLEQLARNQPMAAPEPLVMQMEIVEAETITVKAGSVEIVKDGYTPWGFKIIIDGVEQQYVRKVVLTIDYDSLPELQLTRVIV